MACGKSGGGLHDAIGMLRDASASGMMHQPVRNQALGSLLRGAITYRKSYVHPINATTWDAASTDSAKRLLLAPPGLEAAVNNLEREQGLDEAHGGWAAAAWELVGVVWGIFIHSWQSLRLWGLLLSLGWAVSSGQPAHKALADVSFSAYLEM